MVARYTDADRVLDLVRASPGLTGACYRWILGGGKVREGRRVGMIDGLTPQTEAKLAKVEQRLHDLEKRGVVYRSVAAYNTKGNGLGFWPMGTTARVKAAPKRITSTSGRSDPQPRRDIEQARKVLNEVKRVVG